MACACIERVDKMLAERNTELNVQFYTDGGPPTVIVSTLVKEPKRGAKASRMLATFCPFCGVSYELVERNQKAVQ